MAMLPVAFATLIGASLVLFGAGGSIVTVPVLIYAAGLDPHRATATSLVVVGLVAAIGAIARRRGVRVRTGLVFGLAGVVGAVPGAWLNHLAPDEWVILGFGLTAVLAAVRMGRRSPDAGVRLHEVRPLLALAAGAGVGFATGFFGVGGGFLAVPALTLLLGLDPPAAVATSLLVIALNSAAGLLAHGAGAIDWQLGLMFAAAALLGGGLALRLAPRLSALATQRAFAGLLAAVGIGMLASGLGRLTA